MTILITGATGFLGHHLLTQLPRDREIFILVRSAATWHNEAWARDFAHVRPIVGALTERVTLPEGVKLSGIYHAAAVVEHSRHNAEAVRHVNVEGTLNMVRLAAEHGCRLLFVSTSGAVGCFRDPAQAADEHAPFCTDVAARWPYYSSKIEAEQASRALAQELDVQMVVVRPPVMLGPGDYRGRGTRLVRKFLQGRLPFLLRGGYHFVDIRDAAAAMIRAMSLRDPRPVYHLPGTASTVRQFLGALAQVSGCKSPRYHLPYPAAWCLAAMDERLGLWLRGKAFGVLPAPVLIEMGAHYWGLKSLYAEQDLGFKSRPGHETLRDTVAWMRDFATARSC